MAEKVGRRPESSVAERLSAPVCPAPPVRGALCSRPARPRIPGAMVWRRVWDVTAPSSVDSCVSLHSWGDDAEGLGLALSAPAYC